MKVAAYVPIKLNNSRLPGKNIKQFDDGTPLCSLIFKSLELAKNIDEKYCFCSSNEIKEYLPEGVKFLKRSTALDTDKTLCNDIIQSFIDIVDPDIIVLTHATSPFIKTDTLEKCVEAVISGKYDSAFTVEPFQEFLWKDGKPLNFDATKTPRSQDLPIYYRETNGTFVFSRESFEKNGRRVGLKPYLCEVDSIEATDINYPQDFVYANMLYMQGKLK